jgi:hypothetical protein
MSNGDVVCENGYWAPPANATHTTATGRLSSARLVSDGAATGSLVRKGLKADPAPDASPPESH